MKCDCGYRALIIDTRGDVVRRRRYSCPKCNRRFTTYELSEKDYKEFVELRKEKVKEMSKEELIFRIKRNKLSRREAIILLSDFLVITKKKATYIYDTEVEPLWIYG